MRRELAQWADWGGGAGCLGCRSLQAGVSGLEPLVLRSTAHQAHRLLAVAPGWAGVSEGKAGGLQTPLL